jgi:hypothetical protein
MTVKVQKFIISLVLILVLTDLIYIYYNTNTFNALYAGSSLLLFGFAWDALNKLKSQNDKDS